LGENKLKSDVKITIDELLGKVEENKYILSLKVILQSVKIAAIRGQTIPIGNYYTNLIRSAKKALMADETVEKPSDTEMPFNV
jgi:hypothetical protein